jgi:hypothetical protein
VTAHSIREHRQYDTGRSRVREQNDAVLLLDTITGVARDAGFNSEWHGDGNG